MHRLHHLHRLHPFSIIKFIYGTLTYVIWIHLMSSTSTSSRSYTSSTAISSTSVQRLHIFYNFLQYNLRNNSSKSCYTRVVAQEFLHRSSYTGDTGVLTQDFLHGNCHTGVVTGVFTQKFTSRRATCICEFLRNYYFDFSFLKKKLRRQRQPGGLRNVTFSADLAGRTLNARRNAKSFVPDEPSAEIVLVGRTIRTNVWWNVTVSWGTRNTLRKSCASDAQRCGGMRIGSCHNRNPLRRSCVSQTGVEIDFLWLFGGSPHEMIAEYQKLRSDCSFGASDAAISHEMKVERLNGWYIPTPTTQALASSKGI